MKNYLMLLVSLLSFQLVSAQKDTTENGKEIVVKKDTRANDSSVVIQIGAVKLKINGINDRVTITKTNNDSESKVKTIKKKKSKSEVTFLSGFDLGLLNIIPTTTTSNHLNLQTKSVDVHWYLIEGRHKIAKGFNFRWALDMNWKNYRFDDDYIFYRNEVTSDYNYQLDPVIQYSKNKLMARYISVPIMFEVGSNNCGWRNLGLALGVSGSQLLNAKQKLISPEHGKQKFTGKTFGLSKQRLDLVARITLGKITLYGNYGLTPMFNQNDIEFTPNYTPYALGIQLLGL